MHDPIHSYIFPTCHRSHLRLGILRQRPRWRRPLLNKEAVKGNVFEAAKPVELAAAKSPALKKRIGEINRQIIDAKRLQNYGNAHAPEILNRWAKDLNQVSCSRVSMRASVSTSSTNETFPRRSGKMNLSFP